MEKKDQTQKKKFLQSSQLNINLSTSCLQIHLPCTCKYSLFYKTVELNSAGGSFETAAQYINNSLILKLPELKGCKGVCNTS